MSKTPKDTSDIAIGVDIGGTGIKGALIDLASGTLISDRVKRSTPPKGTPKQIRNEVVPVVEELREQEAATGRDVPVGICLPSIVQHGITRTAANISKDWIGFDADAMFEKALGGPVTLLNDADAAGLGEQRYGAAKGRQDAVLVTTLGTGIGSALIFGGRLFPNTELGHLELNGHTDYERYASAKVREKEDLSLEEWAKERLTPYYRYLERLFAPDVFVVSGGISKRADEFLPLIEIETPLVAATLRNNAGIVGAAALAADEGSAEHIELDS